MKATMMRLIVFLLLISACQGIAKEQELNILSYYPYIQSIHNGPVIWHKDTSNPYDLGVMHRAVIIKQETYYGLIIESFKVSDEGGLELVKSEFVSFEMNSDRMQFKSWTTQNTVKIEYGNKPYEIVITEKGLIKRRL